MFPKFFNSRVIGMLCLLYLSTATESKSSDPKDLPKPKADSQCNIGFPKDCTEIRDTSEARGSGVYMIQPLTYPEPFYVYCDMDTDGGGWTVFQNRRDEVIDFYRSWASYRNGFGHTNANHWLGNEKLFYIISQGNYQLRIDMTDFEGRSRYAIYDNFQIGDEFSRYKVYVSSYSGNAGDSLLRLGESMYFTTRDRDNDIAGSENCAITYKGAWWYDACHQANLNGLYLSGHHDSFADGMIWYDWHGYNYSLKTTQMKVRRES